MNNREKFLAQAGEEREILAKVFDKANAAYKKGIVTFTSFLSEREFALVEERRKNIDSVPYKAFGGYEGSGRVMLCFSEYDDEQFPIKAISINGKGIDKLKHPDLLGSIMSTGLERSCVGDIVKGEDEWIVFCEEGIADYIAESLTEVGGVYVQCTISDIADIKVEIKFEEITGTVSSLRADSVVAVMLKTSRSKAQEYIEAQRFYLNQVLCTKCDKEIKENDILTVRHHGKARLGVISGKSKKGRIFITIQKYM